MIFCAALVLFDYILLRNFKRRIQTLLLVKENEDCFESRARSETCFALQPMQRGSELTRCMCLLFWELEATG